MLTENCASVQIGPANFENETIMVRSHNPENKNFHRGHVHCTMRFTFQAIIKACFLSIASASRYSDSSSHLLLRNLNHFFIRDGSSCVSFDGTSGECGADALMRAVWTHDGKCD